MVHHQVNENRMPFLASPLVVFRFEERVSSCSLFDSTVEGKTHLYHENRSNQYFEKLLIKLIALLFFNVPNSEQLDAFWFLKMKRKRFFFPSFFFEIVVAQNIEIPVVVSDNVTTTSK